MSEFSGIKVLIVEDEGFVALMIEDMLQDLGCEVVASVAGLKEACSVAATAEVDLAVLDINLGGEQSFPVAEILLERGVPFIFSTGYGAGGLPTELSGSPVLSKPFSAKTMQETLSSALGLTLRR
ncbi:response regulator [Rhizobium phaseoli]|uniref:Response regulator n=1 Tax=Rhizobium acidisoli TaxID=1538158 RepID=A0AAE5WTK1_9HYPH|nr:MULTISPECIES: response regulator [Rhizobium]KKZ84158.1 response regulator receiver protein [Rhizobium phaseoli Ch24-10]KPH04305.1 chemotaxis protein CheY [Rhizobium acidisoli]QAS82232.1 response regulator [Rhizobium acidisoli]RDJ04711.1 response regulator [Rhizobium phaseoli]RDJ06964.1 response regulator [Rhizobium phaseoli]